MADYANLMGYDSIEYAYLEEVLITASQKLPSDYIVVAKHCWQKLPKFQKKVVLIENSNETHGVPCELLHDNVYIIFASYFPLDQWGDPVYSSKLLPFPLGHHLDKGENKPISERKYDISFSGQIPVTGTRHNFKSEIDKAIKKSDFAASSFINYTDGFLGGLPRDDYLDILRNTKIALCPSGSYSLETFRFFEASRAGCIILAEQLPKMWFYEKSPWIACRWHMLTETINHVIQQGEDFLQELQDATLEFYQKYADPTSMGLYVSHNTINRKDDPLPPFLVASASFYNETKAAS